MSEMIKIILYGSLRNNSIDSPNPSNKLLSFSKTTPLKNLIHQLDIQADKIQLALLNHKAVKGDAMIEPGDRLALFPAEYPIYPDWNDFRFLGNSTNNR